MIIERREIEKCLGELHLRRVGLGELHAGHEDHVDEMWHGWGWEIRPVHLHRLSTSKYKQESPWAQSSSP